MKHHFADMLKRDGGHWRFTPNKERWAHHYSDLNEADPQISALTLSKTDKNWQRAIEFPRLQELTLHEPSADQIAAIGEMTKLRRLRITHARPKSLDFLNGQDCLEEVILEYVSGIDHLGVLGGLSNLTALHLENLRKVNDFSGLADASNLKYLSIDGTFDWKQPVSDFDFLESLFSLEYLRLIQIRAPNDQEILSVLKDLPALKNLDIAAYTFPLEVFAWLEAHLPGVVGAKRDPYWKSGGDRRLLSPPDIRATMSIDELRQLNFTGIEIAADGRRYCDEPLVGYLLGKGERTATGKPETVDARCKAHEARYRNLVRDAKR